ncbi:hypothetical protein KJ707_03025 [Patescibacteria group bacterium]|nr:hypothetical protein [Patescibacteria group bacterium]MBU1966874.1 hypothetical protein [Patescibacteria group bacterium]MBU2543509.1 hypothetical protein [Patescibacteria group bacterium]
MSTKKNYYKFYYFLIGVCLLIQISYTLYQTSFVVAHGQKQRDLKLHHAQLINQKQKLEEKLAIKTSLLMIAQESSLANYQDISWPIVIGTSTNLAALN